MAPKRRTEQHYGASNSMHSPPDQRPVGSPQALAPLASFEWSYHNRQFEEPPYDNSQEATQLAPSTPSRTQLELSSPVEAAKNQEPS